MDQPYKILREVDYNPFEVPPEPAASGAVPEPEVSEGDPTYTIPKAPELPTIRDENAPPPEPEKPEEAAQPYKIIREVDYNPFEAYDPSSDTALTRGAKVAWTGAEGALLAAKDMPRWATLDDKTLVQEMLKRGEEAADPRNAKLQVENFTDIDSAGEALTFLGESIGSLAGSWGAAATYGGLPGAAVGGAGGAALGAAGAGVGAIPGGVAGAVAGGTYGTGAAFLAMGAGGMQLDLLSDPGVRAGLKDGSINPKQLLGIMASTGAAVGAIDALPAGKFLARIGGKEVSKDLVKQLIRKAAVKGALKGSLEEGGTEGLQGAISEITQAAVGGDANIPERALSVLNQAAAGAAGGGPAGAVGGVVENARIKPTVEEKENENEDTAGNVLPEGVPEPGEAADIGASTPGSEGAKQATPPANADETAPAAAEVPVVTSPVDPSIAAGLGATPAAGAGPANLPRQEPGAIPDPDIEEELGAGVGAEDPAAAALAKATRDAFAAQADTNLKAQELKAATVTVSEAGADVAAALTATGGKGRGKGRKAAQKETLGTSAALQPAAPVVNPLADPAATQAAAGPAAASGIPPSPPVPPPVQPVAAATPVPAPQPAAPVLTTPVTAAQPDVSLAPAAPLDIPVETPGQLAAEPTATVEEAQPAAAFLIKRVVDFDPFAAPAKAEPPAKPLTKAQQIAARAKAAALERAAATAAGTAVAPAAPAAKPTIGIKGKAVVEKTRKDLVVKPVAELVRRKEVEGAVAAPAVAEPASGAAAVAGKPKRNMVSREIAQKVHAEIQHDIELQDVAKTGQGQDIIEDTAAEHVSKQPPGTPPRKMIEESHAAVMEAVRERLKPIEDARAAEAEAARASTDMSHEAVQKRKAEAEEAKRKEQAAATSGQKKERVKKSGEKSAVGIGAQSDDAWLDWEKRELKKTPDKRDQRVMRYAQLVKLEKKIDTPENKAKYRAEKQAIKDEIVAEKKAAEKAKAEAPAGLNERAKKVEAKLKDVVPPLPAVTGSDASQLTQAKQHLANFLKAIEGITVAGRIDSVHNSPIENLAAFAKKLRKKDADVSVYGPTEFYMAHYYLETGENDSFLSQILNEKQKGQQLVEEKTGEETGEGSTDFSAALDDSETSVQRRTHTASAAAATAEEQAERRGMTILSAPGDRKGGRASQQARALSQQQRERRQNKGKQSFLAVDHKGDLALIEAEVLSGNNVLEQVRDLGIDPLREESWNEGMFQFMSFFRNMHLKRLKEMVGDIEVRVVDSDTLEKIGGGGQRQGGFYIDETDTNRAFGFKPVVYLHEGLYADADRFAHVAMHELTHAATVQAYRHNVRGTAKIIGRMRVALLKQLRAQGYDNAELAERGVAYGLLQKEGWRADLEFIAEAFSNPVFQYMLASYNVPPSVARDIAALSLGRTPTWWETFTGSVSNAIGMIRGKRGMTYMEQMVALHPATMRSTAMQQRAANVKTWGKPTQPPIDWGGPDPLQELDPNASYPPLARGFPQGRSDVLQFNGEFKQSLQGWKAKAETGWMTLSKHKLVNAVTTTGNLIRKAEQKFGGIVNPFTDLAKLMLQKDPLRQKYRKLGEALEHKLITLKKTKPELYAAISLFMHEASRFQVDPRYPREHPNNSKQISKEGGRSAQQREVLKEMNKEWAAMSPEAKAIINEVDAHYRQMFEMETSAKIRYAFGQAFKKHRKKAPPGKTIEDAIEWIKDGGATRKVEERTAEDKMWHDALGKTAETLGDITHFRRLPGMYVPLMRRGKWFFTATEKVATPNGGTLVPETDNKFFFTDEKKARAFMASTDFLAKLTSRWVDPATGERIHHMEPQAQRQFFVTVQNKRMEMHDHKGKLEARRKELTRQGHNVSQVGVTQKMLDGGASEISTMQLQSLLANLAETTIGNTTIGQQAVQDAVLDAHIRTLTSPGALARGIKRGGVMGYDLDLAGAMREYNQSAASHIANMELAPQMAEADARLQKYIKDRRLSTGGQSIEELQLMRDELQKRITDKNFTSTRDGVGGRVASGIMNAAFLRHLFSPHYTIMQMVQPFMTTYPVLAAQYGEGNAWREIVRAYKLGGIRKTLGKGFTESWEAGKNLVQRETRVTEEELSGIGVHDKVWHDAVAGEPDGKELQDMFKDVRDHGFGASSGIEAGSISEQDQTLAEKALNRGMNMAKALPESAEGINRYTTAISTYRLARQAGASIEEARHKAVFAVEQTQGGYSRANNPRFFNNPLLRFPLQFHKYGVMYAQLFYGNLSKAMNFRSDPEAAKQGAKTAVRLAATTFAFAGIGGLPFIEIARTLVNVALLAGLTEDDWEDDEAGMQEWFASMIGWASGSEDLGDKLSEASMHGLTRLIGADTSASLGAENLVTFGAPQSFDEEGVKAWLTDALVLGAGGGMVADSLKALSAGDIKGAIPWPKLIDNVIKSYDLYTEGTVDKVSGVEYAPPLSGYQAAIKTLGFTPAESAREWEAGGVARAGKEENQQFNRRQALMGQWAKAKDAGDTEGVKRAKQAVKDWNARQTDRKMHIDGGDLYRSRAERKRQKKERQKQREDA